MKLQQCKGDETKKERERARNNEEYERK